METTPEQNQILSSNPQQNICINAAPGSGKTTTIIMRIVAMHQMWRVPLSEIGLFTYNRFLAKDMSDKLQHYGIDPKGLGWCGTIHAFCYRETQRISDLQPWVNRHTSELEVYPNLKYIIFDEYQDVDEDIAKVVEILSRGKFLTIIGDERQQIYGYKGADASRLYRLRSFVKYPLSQSFRCNKHLCKLLSRLYPSYPAIRSKIDGPKPVLYRSKRGPMHNQRTIDQIVQLVSKAKGKSIAIVSPTIRSEASRNFLNDIHSNIERRCDVPFDCNTGEEHNETSDTPNKISSIHGVKGKEFDLVIALNIIDGESFIDYPNPESLCKLFVCLSRSRGELHVFEHLYGRGGSVGSLKWITDNDDCFDHPFGWTGLPEFILEKRDSVKRTFKCREFIRSLSSTQTRTLLSEYHDSELVSTGPGLGFHCGPPDLSGILVEQLLATQLVGSVDPIPFEVYVTTNEWRDISKGKHVSSFKEKVEMVCPGPVKLNYESHGAKVKGIKVETYSGVCIAYVDEKNIISTLMSEEYYKHLPEAKMESSQLTSELTPENVRRRWNVLRFSKLTQLSLTGFKKATIKQEQIDSLINYIRKETALRKLDISKYHTRVRSYLHVPQTNEMVCVEGELDFETNDGVIEIKCHRMNLIPDEDWLQVIIYDRLSSQEKKRDLYVYNALTGDLWKRRPK